MEPIGVSVYGDCLYVEFEDNQGTYTINFSSALKAEIENIEAYMCEANAEGFESVISNLESELVRLKRVYAGWVNRGFEKED